MMVDDWHKLSFESVDLYTSMDFDGDMLERVKDVLVELQPSWPDRGLAIRGGVESEGTVLRSHLEIRTIDVPRSDGHVHLNVDFEKRDLVRRMASQQRVEREQNFSSILKVLGDIGGLQIPHDVHGTVTWLFPSESVTTLVQLPLMTVSIPGLSSGQITGVRFTLDSAEEHEYVVLDLNKSDEIRLITHFVFPDGLSADLLPRVIEYREHLKGAFVNEK